VYPINFLVHYKYYFHANIRDSVFNSKSETIAIVLTKLHHFSIKESLIEIMGAGREGQARHLPPSPDFENKKSKLKKMIYINC
jgi:hypothetical protein